MRPLYAEIDLAALRHNLKQLGQRAGSARVMAVVKADAYGHGVANVLPALTAATQLAVACIDEAVQLRRLGETRPIVLLEGVFSVDELALCAREHFIPVIHNQRQLSWLRTYPEYAVSAWLKLDTGMHRLGFYAADFATVVSEAVALSHVDWLGVLTHFACADEKDDAKTRLQQSVLSSLSLPSGWQCCLANSAALLRFPQTCADWVRPGLALYGISPLQDDVAADWGLRPVMRLCSEVIAVRHLAAGETAGYAQAFTAPRAGMLATIALGYGDGFPRAVMSGAVPVWIEGQYYPLVGRIAMDMALVWVGQGAVELGAQVVVWGAEYPVELLARAAQTIPYTLTTMLTARVRREVRYG